MVVPKITSILMNRKWFQRKNVKCVCVYRIVFSENQNQIVIRQMKMGRGTNFKRP